MWWLCAGVRPRSCRCLRCWSVQRLERAVFVDQQVDDDGSAQLAVAGVVVPGCVFAGDLATAPVGAVAGGQRTAAAVSPGGGAHQSSGGFAVWVRRSGGAVLFERRWLRTGVPPASALLLVPVAHVGRGSWLDRGQGVWSGRSGAAGPVTCRSGSPLLVAARSCWQLTAAGRIRGGPTGAGQRRRAHARGLAGPAVSGRVAGAGLGACWRRHTGVCSCRGQAGGCQRRDVAAVPGGS